MITIIVVKTFHNLFEFFSLNFLLLSYFLYLLFVFVLVRVVIKINSTNRTKVCRRLNLFVNESFILILSEPWMSKDLFNTVNSAQSLLWLFTEEPFQ